MAESVESDFIIEETSIVGCLEKIFGGFMLNFVVFIELTNDYITYIYIGSKRSLNLFYHACIYVKK